MDACAMLTPGALQQTSIARVIFRMGINRADVQHQMPVLH